MRVCSFKWCVFLLNASLVSLSLSGCTSFLGATLPPGAAGGTFSQNPKGVPKMSRVMYGHQMDLNSAAIQRMQMQFRVLRLLKITSKDFQKQFLRQATTWERTFTDLSQLKGRDVDLVLEGAHWAVELDALLFSVWKDYRDYLPYASEPDIYAPARGANLLDKQTRMKGGIFGFGRGNAAHGQHRGLDRSGQQSSPTTISYEPWRRQARRSWRKLRPDDWSVLRTRSPNALKEIPA